LAVAIIVIFSGITAYFGIFAIVHKEIAWNDLKYFDARPRELFLALPIISLAYTCQLTVFPIWKELSNPTLPRMNIVVMSMAAIAFTLYSVVGFFGYAQFPDGTPSNIIKAFVGNSNFLRIFFDTIRGVFGLAIICHYPVVHFAFRNSIEVTFFSQYQFSWIRHFLITALTVAASTAWAIELPDLGRVFDLTGSFAAFPICFILPALVYLKLVYWNDLPPSINGSEMDPLFLETQYGKPTRTKRLVTPNAILAMVTLVVTAVCCVISIYVSIMEFFPPKVAPMPSSAPSPVALTPSSSPVKLL
jgi:amino acid permease